MPTLGHYLVVSAFLLGAGIATMLLKRNPLGILMGIELIVNAATVNIVAFGAFNGRPDGRAVEGHVFALLIILVAAAQAVIAVAIFLNFYRSFHRMDVERARTLRSAV
jgi:NADH:ubiquinone oxidoreductase subunit K